MASARGSRMRYGIVRMALVLLTIVMLPSAYLARPVRAETDDSGQWAATSDTFAPQDFRAAPYLGNGRIGTMLPPSGGGYQGYGDDVRTAFPLQEPRYTGTYLAGFYARSQLSWNNTQVIAALPAWSGFTVEAAGQAYRPDTDPATVRDYRQTMDFRAAKATTLATWTPDADHPVELTYETFVSRARPDLAVQKVTVRPHFSGPLTVTDLIDRAAARRASVITAAADPGLGRTVVGVRADGTDDTAYLVSAVDAPAGAAGSALPGGDGIAYTLDVRDGGSYGFVKYVGISSDDYGPDPRAAATAAAEAGRAAGFDAVGTEHVAAWDALWRPAIRIAGRDDYGRWVRTALYSVLASVRAGDRWSVQPAGLSSDDYGGLTFWDAETWIFPTLLALYPELARTVVEFRVAALPAAQANAHAYGLPGALYPWDEGPGQRCASPAVCGLVEEHLHNEIVLAQWQYYLATGDEQWLRADGAPVIAAIADYLTARVGPKLPDGKYHYAPVGGADEYVATSVDNALTNGGVMNTMRIARRAAQLAGLPVDPRWADIEANMAMPPDIVPGVPAEYLGYAGAPIKQADTVLLSYPFSYAGQGYSPVDTLHYYFDRTDPGGPNMSNSVGAILSAQYDPCRTQEFLDQGAQPYVRPPYGFQSEARGDRSGANAQGQSAWIFVTGSAGFLQGLLYGPTGLRWTDSGPRLDPMLPSGFRDGMTVRGLAVGDGRLTVRIEKSTTTVTVTDGGPVTLETPLGRKTIGKGDELRLPTRPSC
ncbi:haloacid dehalogenase [Nocardia arthritidis]|uniref:Haloacid dehalogenase n=2 Tax=Nocardia arthritidis TaxID=228602 RepID=A0A6G9YDR2_9NOCA|nr:haloacid dehalogenase [Nocardia arthritidis]